MKAFGRPKTVTVTSSYEPKSYKERVITKNTGIYKVPFEHLLAMINGNLKLHCLSKRQNGQ